MQLDGRGDLAAAELAFYGLAFILSAAVCAKQHFGRHLCWIYPVLISILRIVGASCILDIETQNDNSLGLEITAGITSAIGTAPLLMALLGFVDRINLTLASKRLNPMIFPLTHLFAIVGLVLSIVGGVLESGAGDFSTGRACLAAGSIVFLVVYLVAALSSILIATRRTLIPTYEKKLMYATVSVLPFLLVRIVFSICVGFSKPGSKFYFKAVNVWYEAFML